VSSLTSIFLAQIYSVKLRDNSKTIAILSLSTAHFNLLTHGTTRQITARLGRLSLNDGVGTQNDSSCRKDILSIDGSNFIDLRYEVFGSASDASVGFDSSLKLHSAPIRINFWEIPVHNIYLLMVKFRHLKSLYDAATSAAVQQTPSGFHMQFDIHVQSPVLTFPGGPSSQDGCLVLMLGQLTGTNSLEKSTKRMDIGISGLQLYSRDALQPSSEGLKIIEDIALVVKVEEALQIETATKKKPTYQVCYP
jgi:vacuolar protein sorting-associated protein 13A/C